jgi:capsular polysaccharide biosynthesis protein
MALEPQAPVADPEPLAALARAVRRFWWVVVLVTLLAVGAAALKLSARTSDYRASAQLLILPLPQYDQTFLGTSLLRDGGDPKLTAATAAQIVHSRAIAADASARLGGRPAADSVLTSVSVTPSTDANVLRVSAQDGRRAGAVRLANAYVAAVLVERWRTISPELERRLAALESRRSQLGAGTGTGTDDQLAAVRDALAGGADPTLKVLQPAASAVAESRTSTALILILALVGGAFLGLLAAVALDHLGGRLRDEDDALVAYSLPIWGRVARARRRGAQLVVGPASERGAYQTLASHVDRWCPETGAIGLISAGRGDGRTTAAAGIAAALSERGRSAAFVYTSEPPADSLVSKLEGAGVPVLSAGPGGLSKLLEDLRGRVDIVVIDGPPVSRGTALLDLTHSADLLLVARIGHTGRHDLRRGRDVLEGVGARPAGLLLLGVDRRGIERSASVEEGERRTNPLAPMP